MWNDGWGDEDLKQKELSGYWNYVSPKELHLRQVAKDKKKKKNRSRTRKFKKRYG